MNKAPERLLYIALLLSVAACTNVSSEREPDSTRVSGVVQAVTAPSGFVDELVVSGFDSPTSFVLAPDGRMFVAEQAGRVRVVRDGALLATPVATLPVRSEVERGLLGIALDPGFPTSPYLYVFYTATTLRNRISRLRVEGDLVPPSGETVLLELDAIGGCTIHMGGALQFAPDGSLFIGVGDTCEPSHAQALDRFAGKLLRIRSDGSIPTDNPHFATAVGNYRAIWARGLRNPYTFAISRAGRIFINDVGLASWEEINEGQRGANYGWPESEGTTELPGHTSPLFAYPHSGAELTGCAVTGGTFYEPTVPQFPSVYVDKYLFADYCASFIRTLDPNNHQSQSFVEGAVGTVDLRVAADGALYRLERDTNSIFRLRYASTTVPPSIDAPPRDAVAAAGASVTFSVAASGTPPLRYQWQRNGSDVPGATGATHTFTARLSDDGAVFRVLVANGSGSVTSSGAALRVLQNSAPVASIGTPTPGTQYSAGTPIAYSGSATDAEDGSLPASAFTWEVVLHHAAHTHPFIAPFSGQTAGSFVIPRIGHTETDVFYRIHLRVRDSAGLEHATFRDISPRLATLSLRSDPPGLTLTIDGSPVTAPAEIASVVGVTRALGVVSPQTRASATYHFQSWSNGGPATQTIDTPTQNTTYTASFRAGCQEAAVRAAAALASSVEHAALGPEKAIDGDRGTRWSSAFQDGQWLRLDFGSPQPLSRVVLHWEAAYARNYELQISDRAEGPYRTVATRNGFGGGSDTFSGLTAQGRYLRIYATTRATAWGNSLWEVETYATPSSCGGTGPVCGNGAVEGSEQCDDGNVRDGDGCSAVCTQELQQPPCSEARLVASSAWASSSASANLGPERAIDGNLGNRWASSPEGAPWLVVDLGTRRYVNRALLHWEVAYARDYRLEIGDAPAGPFTSVATRSAFGGGADLFVNLGARGRYLRLFTVTPATALGISLWELELFGDLNASCAR